VVGVAILRKIHNPRLLCFLFGILFSASLFISSYAKNLGVFVAFMGIVFGIAAGCSYFIPILASVKFFEHKRPIVAAILVSGFGFGALIYGFIFYALVNPDNLSPNEHDDENSYFSDY